MVLHNRLFLESFAEFCIKDFTIESLLFFIDVENFLSCTFPKEKANLGKYIVEVYLRKQSPLKLNLSDAMRKEIRLPKSFENDDPIHCFDEVQDYVYTVLKGHSFSKFTKTEEFHQFLVMSPEHRIEYMASTIKDPYYFTFAPNKERIRSTGSLLTSTLDADDTESILLHSGAMESTLSVALPSALSEQILRSICKDYFPSIQAELRGYFDRLAHAQKEMKRLKHNKEKKIVKFFGDQPGTGMLQRQDIRPQIQELETDEVERKSLTSLLDKKDVPAIKTRKKKLQKLHGFFGDAEFTNQITGVPTAPMIVPLNDKGKPDSSISEEEEVGYIPETSNQLSGTVKKELKKRHEKIVAILGRNLDESTTKEILTQPVMRVKGTALDSDSDDDVESRDTNSTSTSIAETRKTSSVISKQTEEIIKIEREKRLRKLQKLSKRLGERITEEEIVEAKTAAAESALPQPEIIPIIPQEEKEDVIRRGNKLEQMFGQRPPLSLTAATQSSVKHHREHLQLIQALVDSTAAVKPVIDSPTADTQSFVSITSSISPSVKNRKIKRKRLMKLKKFFGSGNSNSEALPTDVSEIEKAIDDDINQLAALKKDVELLKKSMEVRRKTLQDIYNEVSVADVLSRVSKLQANQEEEEEDDDEEEEDEEEDVLKQ